MVFYSKKINLLNAKEDGILMLELEKINKPMSYIYDKFRLVNQEFDYTSREVNMCFWLFLPTKKIKDTNPCVEN